MPHSWFKISPWVWWVCQAKQKHIEGKARWEKHWLNPQNGCCRCRCLLSLCMSFESAPRTCKQDSPGVQKVNNLHPRMIQIISSIHLLALPWGRFYSEVIEPFHPCIPIGTKKKPCSTLHYAPSWHILLAQVNTCTFWIWSVGIVFAGKHSFSLSCKQDKKAKANVHSTGKTPACMPTWWTHLSACRFLLAPLSQQIPVDCLLIPANMPLVAFT